MFVLTTDFGLEGPYLGQMKAVLAGAAPGLPVIDLFADIAPCAVRSAAYLLAAYAPVFPAGSVHIAVVDPGVGSARGVLAVAADGQWFVGPDNGLLQIVVRRARQVACYAIDWRPVHMSASFHGRDLFAPLAARIAHGELAPGRIVTREQCVGADWPDDLQEVAYIDRFGNAITGLRAGQLDPQTRIAIGGRILANARTFSDVPVGTGFWYANANGLVEIAINQGRADVAYELAVGDAFSLLT